MIRALGDVAPRIHPSAYIDETAVVIGDVEIGENCSVWPGAVIRGDFTPIKISRNTNVQDNAVVHTGIIGNAVTIGHGATVHCKSIGNNVLVGIKAALLDDVEIGEFCLIAAGAVVSAGIRVPPYSFVAGVPARVRELKPEWVEHLKTASEIYLDTVKKHRGQTK